jgi:hypothetical protein
MARTSEGLVTRTGRDGEKGSSVRWLWEGNRAGL